jgi:hypothetical protein
VTAHRIILERRTMRYTLYAVKNNNTPEKLTKV